jgi:urease accessory protein
MALECDWGLRHNPDILIQRGSSMRLRHIAAATLAIGLMASPALAHPGHLETSGLIDGFIHPFSGLDHVLVMLAVGVMAAQMGGKARYLLPATFLGVMVLAGAFGMAGHGLPYVDFLIAISVFVLGLTVAQSWRLSTAAAMALVGIFAVFHGFAHGAEMPVDVSGLFYGLGFVAATAALHVAGIALGQAMLASPRILRAAGVLMTAAGISLLAGWM